MNQKKTRYQQFEAMCTRIVLLLCFFGFSWAYAQGVVEVGGPLAENTTWTSDYIYVVTDDLTVPPGLQLTIMPGTRVKFYANRGLFISGSLKVMGEYEAAIDTVRFSSYEGQIWKGIQFNSVTGDNNNLIDYALIDKADIGIDIRNSDNVVVSHSKIQNGVTSDIRLFNSSYCVISENRLVKNGRVGLEIYATSEGNASSFNQIENNFIADSRYTNLLVRFENGGECRNNIIEKNLFFGAEAGIFIDNSVFNSSDIIYIRENVFYNNGGETIGYSISTGMDSTVITNNIFWDNTLTAVQLRRGKNSVLANNSFYGNRNCLAVNLNARMVEISQNTITENINYVAEFNDPGDLLINANNIFHNHLLTGSIRNNTANELDIRGQYWGTTDTLAIDELIWDFFDDGLLGEMNFLPFLTEANTDAPISPPHNAKMQLVENNTLISWQPNPETDHSGYAVYSGDFGEYRFSMKPIVLDDTCLLVPGNQLDQIFAVTAFDFEGHGLAQQRNGHESPFAFPVIYPYAGSDTAICINTGSYPIRNSSIPFVYDAMTWSSNGDGYFNNQQLPQPDYFPGAQDLENGCVTLTLTVQAGKKVLSDSFKLTLSNIPFVYAGSDTLVQAGAELFLQQAIALHYEELNWTTTGDGFFVDSLLIRPVYIMGPLDIENGEVELILTASSACGIVADTIKVMIRNQFSVEGIVLSQNTPVSGCVVLAIYSKDGSYLPEIAEFTHSNDDGTFRFKSLFAGNYKFYALPDTVIKHGLMPAYYFGKQKWQKAYELPLVANTYHVEIELSAKGYELPVGKASISGMFKLPPLSEGIKNYCTPWFADDYADYCSGGLSNVTIILYNDKYNIAMDYTITDYEGRFIFNGLPYGSYIIDAEIPGYQTIVSSLIELNREVPEVDNITLRIEPNRKIGVYSPEIKTPSRAFVYPNPSNGVIYLNHDCESAFEVKIFNTYGQQIDHKRYNDGGPQSKTLNVSEFTDGLYIGHLICNDFTHTFSFIVQH